MGLDILGQYTIIISLVTVFFAFSSMGIISGISREAAIIAQTKKNIGGLFLISYFFIIIVSAVLSIPFMYYFYNYKVALFKPLLFASFAHLSITIPCMFFIQFYISYGKPKYIIIGNLAMGVTKILCLFCILYFSLNIINVITATYLIPFSAMLMVLIIYSKKILDFRFIISGIRDGFVHFKNVLSYSFRLLLVSIAEIINGQASILILAQNSSLQHIGEYKVIISIFTLLITIPALFGKVLLPALTKYYYENNYNSVYNYLMVSQKICFTIFLPIVISIISFSTQILGYYGIKSPDSTIGLIIVVFANLILSNSFIGSLLGAYNKPQKISLFLGIGATINLVLCFLLIPQYGIIGASSALLISHLVTQILVFSYAGKLMGKPLQLSLFVKPIINGVLMFLFFSITRSITSLGFPLLLGLGLFFYIILSFKNNSINKNEYNQIIELVKTIKNRKIKFSIIFILNHLRIN